VAEFVRFFFSIGGLMSVLAVGFVWLSARPKQLAPARFIVAVLAAFAVVAMYPASHAVASFLAAGYRPLERKDVPAGRTAIVILGSGSFVARDWDDNRVSAADPASADRALEAARVYRLIDPEWIISSGGAVGSMDPDAPSGKMMADVLIRLGVPSSRILLELDSQTTHDEAVIVKSMLDRLQIEHVVLVTSEVHMWRSVGTFRAVGLETIPAIARSSHSAAPWNINFIPSEKGLQQTQDVTHELLGIGYYAARGWYK
jgi:uncharacterized SAM-binding protein YcdF (DUF218 family)